MRKSMEDAWHRAALSTWWLLRADDWSRSGQASRASSHGYSRTAGWRCRLLDRAVSEVLAQSLSSRGSQSRCHSTVSLNWAHFTYHLSRGHLVTSGDVFYCDRLGRLVLLACSE